LENPKLYIEKSPFFRLPSVTTPVIAFTGTEDRNVPPGESWSLFRALQQTGRVPVRLVLFPGEPLGLKKIAHQRRKLEEEVAWLDRYLFRTGTSPLDPVKRGSLLEGLLARAKAESVDGFLGRRKGGSLVPETVPFQGLDVSRFEITRAQYAAFDRESRITPGEENLPVTGVSFAKAKAYAEWLAAKTGRSFRLPTRAEAERFAQAAGTGGNTLDRWAGYAPNPEEAARLVEVAESTTRPGSLLLPVGSTAGMGDPAVFDLDGNAAEWAADEKGKGVVVGPSADRSVDADAEQSFRAAYTGFRVVAE
jgi:formylglycine-generating enzyme required for sulfatase activity